MKYPFLLLFFLFFKVYPGQWLNPSKNHTFSYVYAPGMNSSEVQLARYCPAFTASTGELVSCSRGIETIQNKVQACTFAEINLSSGQNNSLLLKKVAKAALMAPLLIWLNKKISYPYKGILNCLAWPILGAYTFWKELNFAACSLANRYYGFTIKKPDNTIPFSVAHHWIDFSKLNLGQETDIKIYHEKVQKAVQQNRNRKLILYGASRGSAVVFEYLAAHNSDAIAAIVCEGMFDSIPEIYRNGNVLTKLKINMLCPFTQGKFNGICPLKSVDTIPTDKPIALITSMADAEVPFQHTVNMYKKLQEKGCKKAHLLILRNAGHNSYAMGDEKEEYQNFMHAFYKRYDLPHIPAYADKGQKLLDESQPNWPSISKGVLKELVS